ncbi:serine/threonine-protein kinase [Actinomadura rudentiformis]|uniref:Serine/threonine protein kinase n=1 Tax=Actinomadura rudentiformis TaxID=359158 RepID=A0A6H9Y9T7_9ACTN|nr:serine/threonine-protein kinase [Actinomadura rudentiformis]KAB2341270.1 serine/threonine protein kinase [Actinomadura rudentiformis]
MQPADRPTPAFAPLEAGDPPLIGGYRVLARIGAGRVGQVYLATTQSGRWLAIKVAHSEFAGDAEFRRRLQDEVRAAQRVAHRYLATVVDAHPDGPERPWVATKHVPGPSLAYAVAEHGPLPADTVRTLVAGLARGLRKFHEAGLVHGDLKPSNVLLAADGPTLVDFGTARAAAAVQVTGSPLFMAPEQTEDHDVTPAADVFALGGLAFYAATGRSAFASGADGIASGADGIASGADDIAYDQPELAGCPSVLRGLIQRCLAPSPGDRPSVEVVLDELEHDSPGEGWLPATVAARLPLYETDPPKPTPAPLPPPHPADPPEPLVAEKATPGGVQVLPPPLARPQILPPIEAPVTRPEAAWPMQGAAPAYGTVPFQAQYQTPPVTPRRDSTGMMIAMTVLVVVGAVCSFVLLAVLL